MEAILELILTAFEGVFGDALERAIIISIPDEKLTPKTKKALSVVTLIIGILFFAMLFFGISLLITEGIRCVLGWVFVGIGALYTIACIVINVFTKSKIR